jgi:ABC-type cobalamin/Fe3+-siderophores transport system ATPase subunit
LARCLAKKPNLLILNDFFGHLSKCDKLSLIEVVTNPENKWTLIATSNDPLVMAACDRVLVMEDGTIAHQGTFEELVGTDCLNDLISKNTSTNA